MRTSFCSLSLGLVIAVTATACGGDDAPAVDPVTAHELADDADAVAAALDAGDDCDALDRARALSSATAAARDEGRVSDRVAAEVLGVMQRLREQVTCDVSPSDDGDDNGNGDDGNGDDGNGDDKDDDKDDSADDGADDGDTGGDNGGDTGSGGSGDGGGSGGSSGGGDDDTPPGHQDDDTPPGHQKDPPGEARGRGNADD